MAEAHGFAPARTALVGNPSDGYGGAVMSVTLDELGAHATARLGATATISPPSTLVAATARRFARRFGPIGCVVEWTTSVPEGVGLGGSSAIVIACTRALCELYDVSLDRDELAAFALAVEREDLAIAGGRQDQFAEAYGGLTSMDFATGVHQPLDPALLPPLVVAWREDCSEHSGVVHGDLRERWAAGDREVSDSMSELAELARDAARALSAGDAGAFAHCVDRSFDLRERILSLDPRHVAMISAARAVGASANYSGSGGAIVAVCGSEAHREQVLDALRAAGCGVLAPALSSRDAVGRGY
jgi:glucuronokinase